VSRPYPLLISTVVVPFLINLYIDSLFLSYISSIVASLQALTDDKIPPPAAAIS